MYVLSVEIYLLIVRVMNQDGKEKKSVPEFTCRNRGKSESAGTGLSGQIQAEL